jgi:hypothetical protein
VTQSASISEQVVLSNLTEQTIRFESVGSGSMAMQVGDGGTFYNNIYDADDTVVGNTVGMVIAVERRPDGHVLTEYVEVIQLPDGTVRTHGTVDRLAMFGGAPITLEVVGTSGRYEGMRGTRECRLLPPFPPTTDSRVAVTIVLEAAA